MSPICNPLVLCCSIVSGSLHCSWIKFNSGTRAVIFLDLFRKGLAGRLTLEGWHVGVGTRRVDRLSSDDSLGFRDASGQGRRIAFHANEVFAAGFLHGLLSTWVEANDHAGQVIGGESREGMVNQDL